MIDGIKYYASAVLFVILCFLDAFFYFDAYSRPSN